MDKEKILNKIAEMEGYVSELKRIAPKSFNEYKNSLEKRRACERLLQISIEAVIDVCNVLVTELKLGLPSGEEDVLEKVSSAGIISKATKEKLKRMRKFRNVIVHRYGILDDKKVFENIKKNLKDFNDFEASVVKFLKSQKSRVNKMKTKNFR